MKVIDSLVEDFAFRKTSSWMQFQNLFYGWRARRDAPGVFWHKNFVLSDQYKNHYDKPALISSFEEFVTLDNPLSNVAKQVSVDHFQGKPLTRIWVNAHTFGDEGAIHRDFPLEYAGRSQSLVWYPVLEWDAEWGGDFCLFDESNEITHSIVIKPNRAVVFDGTIKHSARPISRYCNAVRFAISFALEDLND